MAEIEILGINFTDTGAVFQYMEIPTDVRVKGAVVLQHQMILDAGHPDYREDIEALHAKATRVIKNALEDWSESEPFVPSHDDEDDEDGELGGPVR